jgi:hypothetical protein|tara:strand:- start:49 stop:699 length:651 start_codon:yes stop_codon:yes gene_type:complete
MAQIKLNAALGLEGTLPAISGANLTTLNASNISSGTLNSARFSGGSLIHVHTTTISSSTAEVDLTSVFDSTYKRYMVDIIGYSPISNSTLRCQYIDSGGAKTGDYYIWSMKSQSSNGDDWDSHSGSNTPYIGITGESIFNGDNDPAQFRIFVDEPSHTSHHKRLFWTGGYSSTSEYAVSLSGTSNYYADGNAITGLRFYPSTGNVEEGIFKVYGVS